ncbi:hypothetical protein B7494_g2816 [Chlorociboria aeruginascens]|nr:hypothetical protein B7494_g2816 [Chlorociboria aeruginascens]
MASVPFRFILDFDGTVTTKDAIMNLAAYGLEFQKRKNLDLNEAWNNVITEYSKDYTFHIENDTLPKETRDTLEKEIDFQRSLREVEHRSFNRVSNSGIFKEVSQKNWEEAGMNLVRNGNVHIRRGFEEFTQSVMRANGNWGIVSVNFSSCFIRGVLRAGIGNDVDDIQILANYADKDGILRGPGSDRSQYGSVMATSDSKLAAMKQLLRSWNLDASSRVVYIGDSGTDIECLTGIGTVGIVMSEDGESSLMKTLRRIQIDVLHIEEYRFADMLSRTKRLLYWARDFGEIIASPFWENMENKT